MMNQRIFNIQKNKGNSSLKRTQSKNSSQKIFIQENIKASKIFVDAKKIFQQKII